MPEIINKLIEEKIVKYPGKVQKLIRKALELAEYNQESVIAEQLEGYVRDLTKES